jgi:hypothetical protein
MMSEPSIVQYGTLDAGAEVALRTTQGKFKDSCSRDPTVSATQTHLARTLKPAKGSTMGPDNTAVEQKRSFGAANPVILDQLLISTQKTGSQLTCDRPIYNREKKSPLSPANVSLTIGKDGHAVVIDRRQKHSRETRVEGGINRSLSAHSKKKRSSHAGLIRKLRWLALSLEREPRHCSVSLLEGIDASIRELRNLRYYIWEAERKALTTAFHGQPPGVVLE